MDQKHETQHSSPYRRLFVMAVLSFAAMYVLMYAMVDRFANVYPNINQAYMAGLMAAPMVVIELLVMRGMYENSRANAVIFGASALIFALCFAGIREQAAVSDEQFLRSMIPHHAGAILMCEEASLNDREIRSLCGEIREGQQSEIAQMKAKLTALNAQQSH